MAAARYEAGEQTAAWEEMKNVLQEPNHINHRTIIAIHQSRDWLVGLRDDLQIKQNLARSI